MMTTNTKPLGVMKPLGGGDPIPLKKPELMVGRRPTCDIRLDFENVSGKHCQLRYHKGVWHVRDLNSTNGTTVNGQRIASEHGILPDDELGIAGHYFTIDYDPMVSSSLIDANQILEEELSEAPRHRSLMELAGLETEDAAYQRYVVSTGGPSAGASHDPFTPVPSGRAKPTGGEPSKRPPEPVVEPVVEFSDDDFFNMIKGDVDQDDHKPRQKR